MEERRHSDVQLEQRGAAARRPAILVATALVGAVACAFLAESQLQGAGRRDELMVLGPFGIGGKMPWVLSGGTEALLKQLTWDHATSHPEARAPSRGRSAWPARAQQLAMDGDNPALGKVVWRKHEPEASPFDDLEVSSPAPCSPMLANQVADKPRRRFPSRATSSYLGRGQQQEITRRRGRWSGTCGRERARRRRT